MRGPFLGGPGSPDTVSCPEVSYVDDLALFISHEFPSQLCDRVVAITNGLTEIMASFGLQLSIKAVKTDCILKLRGRGTGEHSACWVERGNRSSFSLSTQIFALSRPTAILASHCRRVAVSHQR